MEEKILRFSCPSSIDSIVSENESFDSCFLRVMYHGDNRNRTRFMKESVERALPSMAYCPVVANYDAEADEIGGHDVDVVYRDDGSARLINLTEPVGVIPANPETFWQDVEEENGQVHQYLCTKALIWKRSAAYEKLINDGITAQSMEITVTRGHDDDGIFVIDDFQFTAFALLGVEPCFESAAAVFSENESTVKFHLMMEDMKHEFQMMQSSEEVGINTIHTEGGEEKLDEKYNLLEEFGLKEEDIDFNLDDFSVEELREKFEAMKEPVVAEPVSADPENTENFALIEQVKSEIRTALAAEVYSDPYWGDIPKYSYIDYDPDVCQVYCYDTEDWNMYSFVYAMNGDAVAIDFATKKRVKCSFVEFDEGEQTAGIAGVFGLMTEKAQANDAEYDLRYEAHKHEIETAHAEIEELRQFKVNTEKAQADAEREAVFANFEDLAGNEMFEALRDNCDGISVEDLEDKCYAIRGRVNSVAKFSNQSLPRIPVENHNDKGLSEPYGGLFAKYGEAE